MFTQPALWYSSRHPVPGLTEHTPQVLLHSTGREHLDGRQGVAYGVACTRNGHVEYKVEVHREDQDTPLRIKIWDTNLSTPADLANVGWGDAAAMSMSSDALVGVWVCGWVCVWGG